MRADEATSTGWMRVARTLLGWLGRLSPPLAGQLAYQIFCWPIPKYLEPAEQAAIAKAKAFFQSAECLQTECSGHRVPVWRWRTSSREPRGQVLLVHGWTSEASHMAGFVRPLLRAGFDVVSFDAPAHGSASGRFATLPLFAQSISAVNVRIGAVHAIVAHSLGAMASAFAVEAGLPVRQLVLLGAPNSVRRLVDQFARAIGLPPPGRDEFVQRIERAGNRQIDDYNSSRMLRDAQMRILLVHDQSDDRVPIAEAIAIAQSRSDIDFIATDGHGHSGLLAAPQVIRHIVRFLRKEL